MRRLFRAEPRCVKCKRITESCRCRRDARAAVAAALKKGEPDPSPRPCIRCGRTIRAGVCPGPDC